jgi:ankyrin repeat protein
MLSIFGQSNRSQFLHCAIVSLEMILVLIGSSGCASIELTPENVKARPALQREVLAAALDGDLAKVKALIKHHPDLVLTEDGHGATPLHYAVWSGNKEVVEFLLVNKAEVDARTHYGDTPLWEATRFPDGKAIVELLLAHNADVNALDYGGYTALGSAAVRGHKDIVEVLLAHHPDVNIKDKEGMTPFAKALFSGHKDIAELLRQHGGHE